MYGTTKYLVNVGNVFGKKQPHTIPVGESWLLFVLLAKYFVVPHTPAGPQVRYKLGLTRG